MDLKEYQALSEETERHKSKADKAAGLLESVRQTLKKRFGCSTRKEGAAKLLELAALERVARKKFESKRDAFQKQWEKNEA